jgi:hypothetical protein
MKNIDKAKHISCIDILRDYGFDPLDKQAGAYFFLSPWRNEKVPSLAVYANNRWIDYGEELRSKDAIDLYQRLHKTEFKETVSLLIGSDYKKLDKLDFKKEPGTIIHDTREIKDKSLSAYLKRRMIDLDVARKYCEEMDVEFGKKPGIVRKVISFKNDLGGYELRSFRHKASCSPKTITTIKGLNESLVFEGFFDFLSYLMWSRKDTLERTVVVLNGVGLWVVALSVFEVCDMNHLFLNNDAAGQKKTTEISNIVPSRDHSYRYKEYNDLNDFIRGIKHG